MPDNFLPRLGGQDRSAEPVRKILRICSKEGFADRLHCLRRRTTRIPKSRKSQEVSGTRAVLLLQTLRLRTCRPHRTSSYCEPRYVQEPEADVTWSRITQ